MAYYCTPLAAQNMFDPMSLFETPLAQSPLDDWLEGLLLDQAVAPQVSTFATQPFDVFYPHNATYAYGPPAAMALPPDAFRAADPRNALSETLCISPALLQESQGDIRSFNLKEPFVDWDFELPSASFSNGHVSDDASQSSVDHTSPEPMFAVWTDLDRHISRFSKREADDSFSDADASSCSSEPTAGPSVLRTDKKKKPSPYSPGPLPSSLQPIKVSSLTLHHCPMPDCDAELEDKDSAWRGHFKRSHHGDLCSGSSTGTSTPGCRGGCKTRCPCPVPGSKSCAGGAEMTIESVGRHWLNVHIKVLFRCPVCGIENAWRESACARHIRRCVEKLECEEQASRPLGCSM